MLIFKLRHIATRTIYDREKQLAVLLLIIIIVTTW